MIGQMYVQSQTARKEDVLLRLPMKPAENGRKSMYECFHCLNKSVVWDGDFDFEDFGLSGRGIVQECHCTNCNARILYYITIEEENKE